MVTMFDPNNSFEKQMQRVYAITGAKTQVELAALLDVKQSTIANSKKRRNVPDSWLIRLLSRLHVNPDWVLTGEGARYLSVARDADGGNALGLLRGFPTRALVEELLRRIDTLERDKKILESLGR